MLKTGYFKYIVKLILFCFYLCISLGFCFFLLIGNFIQTKQAEAEFVRAELVSLVPDILKGLTITYLTEKPPTDTLVMKSPVAALKEFK